MTDKLVFKSLDELKPYENNPRNNKNAVKVVAESIKEFGFKVPIVIDKNNVIVAGHTRYKASQDLGLETVPCIVADDLTDDQIKAFRLADNKTGELAGWDFDLLEAELNEIEGIDMLNFGFTTSIEIDWDDVEDLSEKTYDAPKKDYLECPHCHHVDTTTHFKKVEAPDEDLSFSD